MQEAPAVPEQGGQGGGVADAFVEVDGKLAKLVAAAQQSEQVPPEAKEAFAAALAAFRQGIETLMAAAKGGGQAAPRGAVAPESGGAEGAVPESMAGVRR